MLKFTPYVKKKIVERLIVGMVEAREKLYNNVTVMEITPEILRKNIPNIKNVNQLIKEFVSVFKRVNPNIRKYTSESKITSSYFIEKGNNFLIIAPDYKSLKTLLNKVSRDGKIRNTPIGVGDDGQTLLDIGHTQQFGLEQKNALAGYRLADAFSISRRVPLSGLSFFHNHLKEFQNISESYTASFTKQDSRVASELVGIFSFVYTVPVNSYINSELDKLELDIMNDIAIDIVDIETSPAIVDLLFNSLKTTFLTGKRLAFKFVRRLRGRLHSRRKVELNKVDLKLEGVKSRFTNILNLQNILNMNLHDQIKINMGKGDSRTILNYRTGRFAKSAHVTTIVQSRNEAFNIFYTYMRSPYDVFLPGASHLSKPGRDPRRIIGMSIRQLMSRIVANNFKVNPLLED